ncbi:MAG: hypothetical protein U1F61_14695 [Opitutaceae bacterium]
MNFPDAAYPDDGDRVKGRRLRQRLWLPLLAFSVLLMGVARMVIRRDMSRVDEDEVERVRSVKPVGRFPTLEELKPGQQIVLTWDYRSRTGRVRTCVVEGGPESIATLPVADGEWVAKGKVMDPPHSVQRVRLTEEQRAGFVCLVECLERGRWLDDRDPAIVRIECLQEGRVAAVREGFAPNDIGCFDPDQILPDPELVAGLGRQRMKELYAFVSLRYEWPASSGELE